MLRRYIPVIVFWMSLCHGFAQTSVIDSLKAELGKKHHDTVRVMLYNTLAREIANKQDGQYLLAGAYADSGLRLAKELDYLKGKAELYRTEGAVRFFTREFDQAIAYYDTAHQLNTLLNDESTQASLLYNIAMIYDDQGKYSQALNNYFMANSIWERLNMPHRQILAHRSITQIYTALGDYNLALQEGHKVIALARQLNDTIRIASMYDQLAPLYLKLKDTVAVKESYNTSIQLYHQKKDYLNEARVTHNYGMNFFKPSGRYNEAKSMLLKSYKFYSQLAPNTSAIPTIFRGLSEIYRSIGQTDSMLYYQSQILPLSFATNDPKTISESYNWLGYWAMYDKQFDKAEQYYQKALDSNRKMGIANINRDAWSNLSRIYQKQGREQMAYQALQKYIRINDSIAVADMAKQIENVAMQQEIKDNQQKYNQQLQQKAEKQKNTLKRRRLILYMIISATVVLSVLVTKLVFNYRKGKQNNILLQEQYEEILQIQEELRQSMDEMNTYKVHLEEMVQQQIDSQTDKDIQLHTLSNNLSGGFIYQKVFAPGAPGKYSYVSGQVESLMGISAATLISDCTTLESVIGKKSFRTLQMIEEECMENMTPLHVENQVIHNGKSRWLSNHAMPHRNPDGIIILDGFVIDVTGQREIQTLLEEAKNRAEESDRLKTVFLANMSHEIRTPMNGIMGFLGFLEQEGLPENKRQHFTQIIRDNVNQLLQLIENIIDISKLEAKQVVLMPRRFHLNELMSELQHAYSQIIPSGQPVTIILDDSHFPDNDEIVTDRVRLRQVLANLIDNAIKYTEKGYIRMGYQLSGNPKELLFFVEDTGIGIPSKQQSVIFELFRQGDSTELHPKYGGTGLGLSISRGLVEHMGGRLWVESELGQGSTFYFTIKTGKTPKML